MTDTFIGPDGRCYQLGPAGAHVVNADVLTELHNLMPPGGGGSDMVDGATLFSPTHRDDMGASVTLWFVDNSEPAKRHLN